MKKFLSLALALTMALTLAACGGKTDTPPADTNDGSTAGQTGGKLVVYSAPVSYTHLDVYKRQVVDHQSGDA